MEKAGVAGAYCRMPFVVMRLSGNVEKFCQGIMTNTLRPGRNAFIDIYGRIVAVFYQKPVGKDLYIAFNGKYFQKLHEHLAVHLKLGKMKMEKAGLNVYFVAGGKTGELGGLAIPEKNFFILLAEKEPEGLREMRGEEFDCLCLENGISMHGREFEEEMIMNTDWKDAVSFTKGCFLGQEIVVKVTQRGKPPKRLVRVAFHSSPPKFLRDEVGREVGEVRSKCFSQKLGKWIAYCSLPNDGKGVEGGEILA